MADTKYTSPKKTKDTDRDVLDQYDIAGKKLQDDSGITFKLEDQKPEFQSAYADYKARMKDHGDSVTASPEEYFKILTAVSHASVQAQKSSGGQKPPAAPQGRYPRTAATQNVIDQGASSGVDLSSMQDK